RHLALAGARGVSAKIEGPTPAGVLRAVGAALPAAAPSPPPAPPPLSDDATAVVAVAAHEIKNALGGIGVALARCAHELRGGGAVGGDDLQAARRELRRLSTMVNDLLDGAR